MLSTKIVGYCVLGIRLLMLISIPDLVFRFDSDRQHNGIKQTEDNSSIIQMEYHWKSNNFSNYYYVVWMFKQFV